MQFRYHDLGSRLAGEIVEVTLRNAANVRLMDSSDFQSYRSGRRHRYIGGHVTQSPYRITIPYASNWYVALDLGGRAGTINYGMRVLPGALPPVPRMTAPSPLTPSLVATPVQSGSTSMSSTVSALTPPMYRPLTSVPSLVQNDDMPPGAGNQTGVREFDVFISHASEDKDEIVRPLAHALRSKELRVWYDEFELRIGDSLRRSIDKGLANSRSGLVILSPSFLGKGWPNYELDGLVTRAVTGEQILLPIWHNLSKQEVMAYSSSLADKVARSTSTHTVEEIASEIAEVIRGTKFKPR